MTQAFKFERTALKNDRKFDWEVTVTRLRDNESKTEKVSGGIGLLAAVEYRLKMALGTGIAAFYWCHWSSSTGQWHKLQFNTYGAAQEFCDTLTHVARYVSPSDVRRKDDGNDAK